MAREFQGARINTAMFDDLKKLADQLLTNFVTVHFPRNEPLWRIAGRCCASRCSHPLPWSCPRRQNCSAYGCHRMAIRHGLWNHGYRAFLDRVEGVLAEAGASTYFYLDDAAVRLLAQDHCRHVGPGDPVNFDPKGFVRASAPANRAATSLTGRCDWQDDELP